MSLIVNLNITPSNRRLGQIRIGRLDDLIHPANTPARMDEVHSYEIKVDGKAVGRVEHRYGDGAWALVYKALGLVTFREPPL